ncbi:MAG: histidinol-phosphate transaminase [Deltaproteobacteria bacterium]|nr:histidinol-phosphate transaminase [Deltaproteobacteria bacterium]
MNLSKIALPHLQSVTPYLPGKPIEEVQREYGIRDCIKLASNENALGPSPRALDAMKRTLSTLALYPEGSCYDLVEALSEKYHFPSPSFAIGNGSCELIDLFIRAFTLPGDDIVTSDRAFCIYAISGRVANCRVIEAPMREMTFDLEAILERVTPKTKLIFIANPNNPTGTYVKKKSFESFLKATEDRPLLVILDEAYFESVLAPDYPDGMSYLKEFPHLVVFRTFSKVHGLAGLRIGYAVASPEIISYIHRVRAPFNVNRLAQIAAIAAMEDQGHIDRYSALLRGEIPKLYEGYRELGFTYTPTAANFILLDVGKEGRRCYEELLQYGLITRPLEPYRLPRHLRITVGRPEENRLLLTALGEIREKLK